MSISKCNIGSIERRNLLWSVIPLWRPVSDFLEKDWMISSTSKENTLWTISNMLSKSPCSVGLLYKGDSLFKTKCCKKRTTVLTIIQKKAWKKKESRCVNFSRKTANLTSFNINTEFLQVSEMKIDFFPWYADSNYASWVSNDGANVSFHLLNSTREIEVATKVVILWLIHDFLKSISLFPQ